MQPHFIFTQWPANTTPIFFSFSVSEQRNIKTNLNDRVSNELERVKLTCTSRGPAHWHLCPYHTCCDCWNLNLQIPNLAWAYRWSAESVTATTAPFLLPIFSELPPLRFHFVNQLGESRSIWVSFIAVRSAWWKSGTVWRTMKCADQEGRKNRVRNWNRNLQCAGLGLLFWCVLFQTELHVRIRQVKDCTHCSTHKPIALRYFFSYYF